MVGFVGRRAYLLCTVFILGQSTFFIASVEVRAILISLSLSIGFPGIVICWVGVRIRRIRSILGLLISQCCIQLMKWSCFSINPFFSPSSTLTYLASGIMCFLVLIACILLEMERREEHLMQSSLDDNYDSDNVDGSHNTSNDLSRFTYGRSSLRDSSSTQQVTSNDPTSSIALNRSQSIETTPLQLGLDAISSSSEKQPILQSKREDLFPFWRKLLTQSSWLANGLSFGTVLFFTQFIFTAPNVIPRFVGANLIATGYYPLLIVISSWIGLLLTVIPFSSGTGIVRGDVWYAVFLTGTMMLSFGNWLFGLIGGILMVLVIPGLWFVNFADLHIIAHNYSSDTITPSQNSFKDLPYGTARNLIGKFMLASMSVFLLLIFVIMFTINENSSYGEFFKWCGLIMFLICAVLFLTALVLLRIAKKRIWFLFAKNNAENYKWIALQTMLMIFLVCFSMSVVTHEILGNRVKNVENYQLNVLTFNVQLGFNVDGESNLDSVSQVVSTASNINIIGLQESDLARVTTRNQDIIEYLSAVLNMYGYYGPITRDATPGCGLLSSFTLSNSDFVLLPSSNNNGILAVSTLEITQNTSVSVVVVHFDDVTENSISNSSSSSDQAHTTAGVINSIQGPLLAIGNFGNGGPTSIEVETILTKTNLRSAYPDAHNGQYAPTNYAQTQVLDYIFYRELNLISADIVLNGLGTSNHLAVVASFSLPP